MRSSRLAERISALGCALIFFSPFISVFIYLGPLFFPTETEQRKGEMRRLSPSGLTKAEEISVYWSRAIVHIVSQELILSGKSLPGGKNVVLGFEGKISSMDWLDETTLHVALPNRTHIGHRVRNIAGIKVLLSFDPDDPDARRRNLEEGKVPRDEWWKYDISP
jgi:hypothetical protein